MTTLSRLSSELPVRRGVLRVLVISVDPEDSRIIRDLLQGEADFRVNAARDHAEARDLLKDGGFDAVVVDAETWCDDPERLAQYIRDERPDLAVVLLVDGEDDRMALPALKLGAHDFVSKRTLDRGQLVARLIGAVDESRTMRRRDTMVRWLEREARTDHLTGLFNRRAFDEQLREVCARAKEEGTAVAVVVMDITGTRMVNDVHGHDAGDSMIRRAAAGIARCLRAGDVAARIGGDDFGVIVPGGSLDLGKRIARRIAHEIERLNAGEWAREIPVSLAFGVASGVACDPGELFAAGEQQLLSRPHQRALITPFSRNEDTDGPSVA